MVDIQNFATIRTNSTYQFSVRLAESEKDAAHGWNCQGFESFKFFNADYIRQKNLALSPIIWNEGRRKACNFISADLTMLDFDDGVLTLVSAQQLFAPLECCIYTTRSHQQEKNGKPPCDRFRVMVAFDRTITKLEEWTAMGEFFTAEFGHDPKVKDGARFLWGSPTATVWHSSGTGVLCVDAILQHHAIAIQPKKAALKTVSEPELEVEVVKGFRRVERIRLYTDYLLSDFFPRSISGHRGHDTLLRACAARFGFAVSRSDSACVIEAYNTTKCDPPWSPEEIDHKFNDAKYDGEIGDRLILNNAMFQESLAKVQALISEKSPVSQSTAPATPPAVQKLNLKKNFGIHLSGKKRPAEIWHGMLYQGKVAILAGESKSHKTWAAIGLGLSVAAGRTYWNHATTKSRVLYVDLEIGDVFLEEDRIHPIMKALNIKPEDVQGYWDVLDCEGFDGGSESLLKSISAAVEGQKYGLIIIDPYYMMALGLDENSNSDMALVGAQLNRMAKNLGASLLIIHHYPKGSQTGKPVHERGSGAGVIAGRNPSLSLGLSSHAEADCYILDGVWRHHKRSEKIVLRWNYPLLVHDSALNPDDERSRNKAKMPLEESHILKAFAQTKTKKEGMKFIRQQLGRKFDDDNFRALFEDCEQRQLIVVSFVKGVKKPCAVYTTNPAALNGGTA